MWFSGTHLNPIQLMFNWDVKELLVTVNFMVLMICLQMPISTWVYSKKLFILVYILVNNYSMLRSNKIFLQMHQLGGQ